MRQDSPTTQRTSSSPVVLRRVWIHASFWNHRFHHKALLPESSPEGTPPRDKDRRGETHGGSVGPSSERREITLTSGCLRPTQPTRARYKLNRAPTPPCAILAAAEGHQDGWPRCFSRFHLTGSIHRKIPLLQNVRIYRNGCPTCRCYTWGF